MQFLVVDIREIPAKDLEYFRIFQIISAYFTCLVHGMLPDTLVKNEPYHVIKHIEKS